MTHTIGRPAHYRHAYHEPTHSPAMSALLSEIDVVIRRSKRRSLMQLGYRGPALRRMMRSLRATSNQEITNATASG